MLVVADATQQQSKGACIRSSTGWVEEFGNMCLNVVDATQQPKGTCTSTRWITGFGYIFGATITFTTQLT